MSTTPPTELELDPAAPATVDDALPAKAESVFPAINSTTILITITVWFILIPWKGTGCLITNKSIICIGTIQPFPFSL